MFINTVNTIYMAHTYTHVTHMHIWMHFKTCMNSHIRFSFSGGEEAPPLNMSTSPPQEGEEKEFNVTGC